MTTTVPGTARTYSTQEAADILGVSPGLLYKIGRDRSRSEFREYGCVKIGARTQWSKERVDAAASGRNAA